MLPFSTEPMCPGEGTDEQRILENAKAMPVYDYIGLEYIKIDKDEVIGKLEIRPEQRNTSGALNGGIIYTLIDYITGTLSAIALGQILVTVDSYVQFLRPAMGKIVYCRATFIKRGRMFTRVQGEIFDENGKLLATCLNTFCPMGTKSE